jgi:hypothetical protein
MTLGGLHKPLNLSRPIKAASARPEIEESKTLNGLHPPRSIRHLQMSYWKKFLTAKVLLILLAGCGTGGTKTTSPPTYPSPSPSPLDEAVAEVCTRLQEIADYAKIKASIPHALIERPTEEGDARYARVEDAQKQVAIALESVRHRINDTQLRDAAQLIVHWHLTGRPPGKGAEMPDAVTTAVERCDSHGYPLRLGILGSFELLG